MRNRMNLSNGTSIQKDPRSDRKLFVMEILDEKCKTLPSSDAKVYAIQPQASRAQEVARLTFSKDR